ncbi:hypothetical protein RJT34_15954 [Clitoria ternatea]|uniref:Uncharacterized protein n=1 Tax=Clitoria ternatea TaxID=43366 RepID=A0AAN9J6J4_CLITE
MGTEQKQRREESPQVLFPDEVIHQKHPLHSTNIFDSALFAFVTLPRLSAYAAYGKHLSGTLNWVVRLGNMKSNSKLVIVSSHLGKETFVKISPPPDSNEKLMNKSILEILGNCLCICYDQRKINLVVWQMKEFGDDQSWNP